MWIILGVATVISTILNVIYSFKNQDAKWFRFTSLSLTALTLCSFYSMSTKWVLNEDWSALMDVDPFMSKLLWIFTIASILINSISLFKKNTK